MTKRQVTTYNEGSHAAASSEMGRPEQPGPIVTALNEDQNLSGAEVAGQQPPGRTLFRPEDMDKLPLPEADKARYKAGLRHLWYVWQSCLEGSPHALAAQEKITTFSNHMYDKLHSLRPGSGLKEAQDGQGQPDAWPGVSTGDVHQQMVLLGQQMKNLGLHAS